MTRIMYGWRAKREAAGTSKSSTATESWWIRSATKPRSEWYADVLVETERMTPQSSLNYQTQTQESA